MRELKYNYEELKQLRNEGLTWKQIGEKYNASGEAVRCAYRRFETKDKEPKVVTYCLNCGKGLTNPLHKFCDQKCQHEYNYKEYIKEWQAGRETGMRGLYQMSIHVRRYMLEKSNYKCSRCGWSEVNPYTNTIPLEVDHIDEDYTNNAEDNLQVLCPNCHSLTATYKGANKGHGREGRRKYNL